MNLIEIFQSFRTQEQAVEYLETVRWRGRPTCPYCSSEAVCRHASGDRAGMRWQCQDCRRAFSAMVGTIFHGTHVPLRNWFLVLGLMLNAKKSASACQVARDVGMRRPTVWSMMHRIRIAMASDPKQNELLHGIVEADETYIGGKPRKRNNHKEGEKAKTGRGTAKTPVIGVVERGGRVVARPAVDRDVSGLSLAKFLRRHVDTDASLLVTDEWPGYRNIGRTTRHAVVKHRERYADGLTHTNTIESFWALVKRSWYGQHHHYSEKYASLYIAEACFKYNRRGVDSMFAESVAILAAA
jgi:transposase-like protein